ncbi:MAG: MFS transporter [Verrucomicrobia bacterium]|nr:MFS transporter [Verrucomicrobiota bacterium]
MPASSRELLGRPTNEWLLLLTLAAVQFTVAVDFVIMLPLGPQLMRTFAISTPQFNLAVSAYAFAAGITGFGSALFLDRFDRRNALLVIYAGFALGTLLCALAPAYEWLVFARAFAGCFGGIVGGVALAIVADLVPEARRASAIGTMMSSFSIAQIAGIPLGLYLADKVNWHAPFLVLAFLSGGVWLYAAFRLPTVGGHVTASRAETAATRIWSVITDPNHLRSFGLMAIITLSGFMIFTDLATYLVQNVGLTQEQLRWVYLVGGTATLVSMNVVGRMADYFGPSKIFVIMMICSMFIALGVTHLKPQPAPLVIAMTTIFMICMTGRFVPAMAIMTGCVESRYRGGFMSINSAVSQFCSALAATAAGWMIHDTASHQLQGFTSVGWSYLAIALTGLWLGCRIRPARRQFTVSVLSEF